MEYLFDRHMELFFALYLLDVIKPAQQFGKILVDKDSQHVVRIPPSSLELNPSRIIDWLFNPRGTFQDVYLPNGSLENMQEAMQFSDKLLPRLASFLGSLDFPSWYGLAEVDLIDSEDQVSTMQADRTLHIASPRNTARVDLLILPKSEYED